MNLKRMVHQKKSKMYIKKKFLVLKKKKYQRKVQQQKI